MKFKHFLLASSTIASATAWSWPSSLNALDPLPHLESYLGRRQNNNNDNSQSSSQPSATAAPQSSASGGATTAQNTNSGSASVTASPGSAATSAGASATSGGSTPQNTSTVDIDPQQPPGGVNMISPAATAGTQYYKVGQTVTWQWNYTSLAITPTAIDILATVTQADGTNPSPFTLAVNESVQATQTFIWDTGKYYSQTSELPIGVYTLIVYDAGANGGYSAVPSPGFLAAYHQYPFGVYTPRADAESTGTALAYKCATCNGAGQLERLTVTAMFGMVAVTVGTFMWFAGACGLS